MLPLWIIDITGQSVRRETFVSLLRQVDHVHADARATTKKQIVEVATELTKVVREDQSQILSQQELLDQWERRTAEKNAIIKGDYWYYSAFDDVFRGIDMSQRELLDTEDGIAHRLYEFQTQLVEAGKQFIQCLRRSNIKPYQTVSIIVLGDATESFSQYVFPSIAAMLQKEKERFLPAHIHQGMCVYGALYVPCDINTYEVTKRNKVLRLLNEVEVQHNLRDVRGYDHMMLYQNVQNRTECAYSLLSEKETAEYLFQCIVHLFFACDATHPLISGTPSNDILYFSMGATSLYFDMYAEDINDASRLASELVMHMKKESSEEETEDRVEMYLLRPEDYRAKEFIYDINKVLEVDLPEADVEAPSPHPILNYMQKNLKRLYYGYYLRLFPAKLLRKIADTIEEATSSLLNRISLQSTKMYKNCAAAMQPAIARLLSKVTSEEGALACLDRHFVLLQEKMSLERDAIRQELEINYWEKILDPERALIPNDRKDFFEAYHEAYKVDVASHNGGSGQAEMKKQATEKLSHLLSEERTVLATIGRSFLAGIACVLAILPILSLASPFLIDLGDVKGHAFFWAILLFMLPILSQLVMLAVYLRKREVCIRVLKAYYSHDAYARLANRIEFEAEDFYNKMIALCDIYLARNKRIKEDVEFSIPEMVMKMPLPDTKFNQPLRSGRFGGEEVIPAQEVEGCRIRVNYRPELISELTEVHYYLLINHFNDEIAILFSDVENKDEQRWEEVMQTFRQQMLAGIQEEMLPREFPTVGEKIRQYERKTGNIHLLDSMIEYAAVNGEIVCESDIEYSDVKVNKDISVLLQAIPSTPNIQCAEYNELYKRYLFITRWRSFEHFSYNRILPTEDFDQMIRNIRIFDDEQKEKQRKKDDKRKSAVAMPAPPMPETPYEPIMDALILWAICPDDTSNEWLKLFDPRHFAEAFKDRQRIRKIMNQED